MTAIETWEDLNEEVLRLYNDKCYAEADALLETWSSRFPGRAAQAHYNRMCFIALSGSPSGAIAQLEQAISKGLWYTVETLRADPDLASLQGLPEFERLAAICQERSEKEAASARPLMPVALPPAGSPPHPALVALHGNNRNAELTMPLWQPACEKGFIVAVPQSTQVSGPDSFVWTDVERAGREVEAHYRALIQTHPVDASRTVIGGFSMGGRVACWLALSRALPVRGFIGMGPWLKDFEAWEPHIEAAAAHGLRGYLIVGDRDVGCYDGTAAMHRMLEAYHVPCQLKVYPGLRHVYPDDFGVTLGEALDFILNT